MGMLPAAATFFSSLVLIIILFLLKHIEVRRERRFFERLRAASDRGALHIKAGLEVSEWYLEKTPWFIAALTRYGIHIGALAFARFARSLAENAHRLADFVSHKRNFERRETRSEYLRNVSEYKNGESGSNSDTRV